MKKLLLGFLSLFIGATVFGQLSNYKYTFKIQGAKDTIFLANYFGKQLYYNDTAVADKNGTFIFSKKRSIKPGKFAIVQPGKMYFELIINEAEFTFKGDTSNLIGNMQVENSLENQLFYQYIKLINNKKTEIEALNKKYQASKSEKEKKKLSDEITAKNKEVIDFQKKMIADHPTALISEIVKMSMDIEIPEPPKNEDGSIDSTFQYYYYRDHYWDNTNLNNDALVRDPSYIKKLETYFDKVVLQHPDTISRYADKYISQLDPESEMFKITVNWLINHYSRSKIMGMDAVYIHMAKNYYMTGRAYWADSATVAKLTEKVIAASPTLIGKKAPAITLFDTTGNRLVSLYSVKAKYTVLYFWDSTCGHCKKATPKLKKIYEELHKYGVEVYAVGGELETDSWKKYIKKNELPWINVSDTPERPNGFRTVYDIFAYPKVFLLDEDKKIIAKQIGVVQLGDILLDKLKLKGQIDFGFEPADEDDEAH
ncbi:TlpA family protein disulfide reductase [Luteibaculum oceani]|uniref:Redoxin domain-containing protein n=1 Tax=Luteibaculum oceani TaxID=1294296 RepID=A0A5C6VB46_9FLAO|nr:TlpA family protein disulfide reductase [Luteibaculum oceani]TXC82114.1 redoxin domain-containing protein [Luteibaculum oceani]